MRITKVVREFMEKTLNEKRRAANEADFGRNLYDDRISHAEKAIKLYLKEVNEEINNILETFNLDKTVKQWGEEVPAAEAILQFRGEFLINQIEKDKIRQTESDRYKKQKEAIEEIELECALGADKESFMKMLNEINFD